MLPILFRSVDGIVNDHYNDPCQRCNCLHSTNLTIVAKKHLTKKRRIIYKNVNINKYAD